MVCGLFNKEAELSDWVNKTSLLILLESSVELKISLDFLLLEFPDTSEISTMESSKSSILDSSLMELSKIALSITSS